MSLWLDLNQKYTNNQDSISYLSNNTEIQFLDSIIKFHLKVSWSTLNEWRVMSGTVHTRVEVCKMDSEMSRLVEQPWFQLICCAICLPCSRNFRWRRESLSGSEYWFVCHCWILEIDFNESLSLSIIRLVNYNVTTSLIYKLIV